MLKPVTPILLWNIVPIVLGYNLSLSTKIAVR
jgi:hypothetical protein